jgi:hypothetical protein
MMAIRFDSQWIARASARLSEEYGSLENRSRENRCHKPSSESVSTRASISAAEIEGLQSATAYPTTALLPQRE